ncbi:MAG: RDD family protein [Gammaproteobacteria bacterium]
MDRIDHGSGPQERPGQEAPAGLPRRLAAAAYDMLLLAAVLFFATVPAVALHGGRALEPHSPLFTLYLLAVAWLYFAWQWRRGGQTLGMKTWHVALRAEDGGTISWRQTLVRYAGALLSWAALGLGFIAALRDPQGRTWHDRWSRTRLVRERQ